jgi:hypothetical protein
MINDLIDLVAAIIVVCAWLYPIGLTIKYMFKKY